MSTASLTSAPSVPPTASASTSSAPPHRRRRSSPLSANCRGTSRLPPPDPSPAQSRPDGPPPGPLAAGGPSTRAATADPVTSTRGTLAQGPWSAWSPTARRSPVSAPPGSPTPPSRSPETAPTAAPGPLSSSAPTGPPRALPLPGPPPPAPSPAPTLHGSTSPRSPRDCSRAGAWPWSAATTAEPSGSENPCL